MMAIFRIAEFKLWLSFRMEREYVLLPLYYGFAVGREFVWTFVPKPGFITDLTVQHANVSRQHSGFFRGWFSCQSVLGLPDSAARGSNAGGGSGKRTFRIGIRKKDTIHCLARHGLDLGKQTWSGHIHRMT